MVSVCARMTGRAPVESGDESGRLDVQKLVLWGQRAARAGDRQVAYRVFLLALKLDPANEIAWLWRAGTAEQPEETVHCLKRVLQLNPRNARARRGLEEAQRSRALGAGVAHAPVAPIEERPARELASKKLRKPLVHLVLGLLVLLTVPGLPFWPARQGVGEAPLAAGGRFRVEVPLPRYLSDPRPLWLDPWENLQPAVVALLETALSRSTEPGHGEHRAADSPTEELAAATAEAGPAERPEPLRPTSYVVEPGEDLAAIAERFGIDVPTLVDANKLAGPNAQLKAGRELTILPVPGVLYHVTWGDTLSRIVARYGLGLDDVQQANAIENPGLILPGQELVLPGAKPLPVRTPPPLLAARSVAPSFEATLPRPEAPLPAGNVIWSGTARVSMYTCVELGGCSRTAMGIWPYEGVVAVDRHIIPLGATVWLDGLGTFLAADTGSAIFGNRIDVFANDYGRALQWGVRYLNATAYLGR